jgi:hypothetical protein
VDINEDHYTTEYAAEHGYFCEYSEEWFVNEDEDQQVKLDNNTSVNMNSFGNCEEFEEYLCEIGAGLKTPPDPNQLELPIQEAA